MNHRHPSFRRIARPLGLSSLLVDTLLLLLLFWCSLLVASSTASIIETVATDETQEEQQLMLFADTIGGGVSSSSGNSDDERPPADETAGACAKQLEKHVHRRNCRYGKCEQTGNGVDFVCHCDEFITGARCDRPSKDPYDPCSSNPCWSESICVTIDAETREFKCLCGDWARGKFCHIKQHSASSNSSSSSSISSSNNDTPSSSLVDTVTTRLTSLAAAASAVKQRLSSKATSTRRNAPPTSNEPSILSKNNNNNNNNNDGNDNSSRSATSRTHDVMTSLPLTSLTVSMPPLSPTTTTKTLATESANAHLTEPMVTSSSSVTTNEHRSDLVSMLIRPLHRKQQQQYQPQPAQKLSSVTTRSVMSKTDASTAAPTTTCNYDTCQLGKCSPRGLCVCVYPAMGRFCDHIDECFALKCVHGVCAQGLGCICHTGFVGPTCAMLSNSTTTWAPSTKMQPLDSNSNSNSNSSISISSSNNSSEIIGVSNSSVATSITTTALAATASGPTPQLATNAPPLTFIPRMGLISQKLVVATRRAPGNRSSHQLVRLHRTKASLMTTSAPPTTTTTTTVKFAGGVEHNSTGEYLSAADSGAGVITGCENGGLFIDGGLCICLNQYTGLKCEIAPRYETAAFAADATLSPTSELTHSEDTTNTFADEEEITQIEADQTRDEELSVTNVSPREPPRRTRTRKPVSHTAEISSTFTTTTTTTTATTTTVTMSSSTTTTTPTPIATHNQEQLRATSEDEEMAAVPFITIHKPMGHKSPGNLTIRRTIHWPWFECFPGDSVVYTSAAVEELNGEASPPPFSLNTKRMSELRVGDRVLVSGIGNQPPRFSRVLSFLEREENARGAIFLRLHYVTADTASPVNATGFVTMTPLHLIMTSTTASTALMSDKSAVDEDSFVYVPARHVVVGDRLRVYDRTRGSLVAARVLRVEQIQDNGAENSTGIFAPLTAEGTLIVDGVHVSCYSVTKSHRVAQLAFTLFERIVAWLGVASTDSTNTLSADTYARYAQHLYGALQLTGLDRFFLNSPDVISL